MTAKFSNTLQDFLTHPRNLAIFKMWGGTTPMSMGDGVRFRVTKSPNVDYVTIRYLSGFDQYEIEFAALVGTEYDLLDRISPVAKDKLMSTISKRVFFDQ